MSFDNLSIRKMRVTDFDVMTKWLSTKEVLEYYGDVNSPFTYKQVKDKYEPRINGEVHVVPYIVVLDGSPIGFMQHYKWSKENQKEYNYPADLIIYGIDQFIGYPELFNQGLGTEMVKTFIDYISQQHDVDIIVLDPEVSNKRAIKCYEKCGFVKVRKINSGDSWLMEYRLTPHF